jgi:hypothetical protein
MKAPPIKQSSGSLHPAPRSTALPEVRPLVVLRQRTQLAVRKKRLRAPRRRSPVRLSPASRMAANRSARRKSELYAVYHRGLPILGWPHGLSLRRHGMTAAGHGTRAGKVNPTGFFARTPRANPQEGAPATLARIAGASIRSDGVRRTAVHGADRGVRIIAIATFEWSAFTPKTDFAASIVDFAFGPTRDSFTSANSLSIRSSRLRGQAKSLAFRGRSAELSGFLSFRANQQSRLRTSGANKRFTSYSRS